MTEIKAGMRIKDLWKGKIEKVIKVNNYPEAPLEKQAIYTKSTIFFTSEEGKVFEVV